MIIIDSNGESTSISTSEDGEETVVRTRSGKKGDRNVVIKGTDSDKGILKVFPNPTNGQVKMNFKVEKGEKVELKVLDLKGTTVFEQTYKEPGDYSEEINLENHPKGIFMFNLHKKGYSESKKIVVD